MMNVGGSERRSVRAKGLRPLALPGPTPPAPLESLLRDEIREGDLAVLDLDDEDRRPALAALLAGRTVLLELDRSVQPGEGHLPEGGLDRLRLVLAGDLDRLGEGGDSVMAAEALGQPLERMAALGPFVHERLGQLAVGHRLREPGHEE